MKLVSDKKLYRFQPQNIDLFVELFKIEQVDIGTTIKNFLGYQRPERDIVWVDVGKMVTRVSCPKDTEYEAWYIGQHHTEGATLVV